MPHVVPRFAIGKVRISAVTMADTLQLIDDRVGSGRSACICVTNVRTAARSQRDEDFCRIQNESFLTVPDGLPLVWYAKLAGFTRIARVAGSDLMHAVLSVSAERAYSHYFYGSTPEVLSRMKASLEETYPGLSVCRFHSPPFRPLTEEETDELVREINLRRPTFLWVGLGAPKQELLMRRLVDSLDGTILVGVGLAFDYAAGTVKRAPRWIRKCGLEWVFRCCQQPVRSKRFVIPLLWFALVLMKALVRRVFFGKWECGARPSTEAAT